NHRASLRCNFTLGAAEQTGQGVRACWLAATLRCRGLPTHLELPYDGANDGTMSGWSEWERMEPCRGRGSGVVLGGLLRDSMGAVSEAGSTAHGTYGYGTENATAHSKCNLGRRGSHARPAVDLSPMVGRGVVCRKLICV